MKLDFIPFQIGMHYENWEFDLEPEYTSKSYDMYKYIKGDMLEFEGYKVTDIFLYFNFDILFQVEMYLEQRKSIFREFDRVENGISIRGRIEELTKLIELTYGKDKVWWDL